MNERKCNSEPSEQRLSSWWPKQGNNAAGQEYSGSRFLTFKLCSAPRESEAGGRSEEFLEKNDVACSDTWPVRTGSNSGYAGANVTRLFSVKIPATDSPAFPMWGSRRALPLCEDASVVQNDGPSQDGMTCTVIPTVPRALPCCCTVVAHGWADWKRASSLRIILHAPA